MLISKSHARRIIVGSAMLHRRNPVGRGMKAVLQTINHLGYVQIDTISVVDRAHHHVLHTRVDNYTPSLLDRLTRERKILEYWSHAAAFLPMEDYRYTLMRKQYFASQKDPWPKVDDKLKDWVFCQLKDRGPLMARDFQSDRKRSGSGWWDWKPAKQALERLFLEGKVEISHRVGFQKVYDLTDAVVPDHIDRSVPSDAEFAEYLIMRFVRSFGMVSVPEICYLTPNIRSQIIEKMQNLIEEGIVQEVTVKGVKEKYFCFPSHLEQRFRVQKQMTVLSPFDNFTIQRKRLQTFFDFDYQIECYVPEPKRKYGYFCLPILYGTELVGRIDAKNHRKDRLLEVKKLHIENEVWDRIEPVKIDEGLQRFMRNNGCREYQIHDTIKHF